MATALHTLHVNELAHRVAESYVRGKAEGMARSLLALLGLLGLAVSRAERARILGTTDPATIDGWFERAATAPSTAAVLGRRRPAPRLAASRPRRRGSPSLTR
jgi:hypothetical protein